MNGCPWIFSLILWLECQVTNDKSIFSDITFIFCWILGVQYVERLGENCTGFSLEPDGDLFGDVLSCYIRCSELQQCRGYVMTLDGIRCTLKGYDCQLTNDAQSVFYEKTDLVSPILGKTPQSVVPQAACGAVPVVENAFVTGSSKSYHENKPGDVVMFSCLPGFEMSGISKLTCLGTGFWDNPAPVCIPLNNHQSDSFTELPDQDCLGGELTGWIRDRRTCETACSEDVSCHGFTIDIKNGSCILKTSNCKLVESLSKATFLKSGIAVPAHAKKVKDETVRFEAVPSSLPPVKVETKTQTTSTTTTTTKATTTEGSPTCSKAPEISNGIIYLASTWSQRRPGDWVSYNCIQGFNLIGNFLISCLPDGSWEYPPECVQVVEIPTTSSSTSTTTSTTTTTTTTTTSTPPTTEPKKKSQVGVISLIEHKHPRFVITNLQCSHSDTLTAPFLDRNSCEDYCLRVPLCDGYTVSVLKTPEGVTEGNDCVPRRRCTAGFAAANAPERSHNFYKKSLF